MGKGKVGEVSWREESLEWVEGAKPLHLTDKLAEIVDVVESTVNSFTLNTFGETESFVARELRRAEEMLMAGSSRISLVIGSNLGGQVGLRMSTKKVPFVAGTYSIPVRFP